MKINPNKSFFWSFVAACIILIAFSSCVATRKQRERFLRENCTLSSTEKVKDSTSTTTTVKYDTTYIDIVGPIQYLPSPCELLCDSFGNLKPFYQESKKNGLKQTLKSVGNVLIQDCNADSLEKVNKELTVRIDRLLEKEIETQIHDNCKLDHVTAWINFCVIGFYIYSGILLLYITFKLVKKYFFG